MLIRLGFLKKRFMISPCILLINYLVYAYMFSEIVLYKYTTIEI